MLHDEELDLLSLGRGGKAFLIGKRDLRQRAIAFGLLVDGLITVVGEHLEDGGPASWLAELTAEGVRELAEHTL